MRTAALVAIFPLMSSAANYTAERTTDSGVDVVRLADARSNTEVKIAPTFGNNAYEMRVNGKNIFWTPYRSIADMRGKPAHLGNPFLAPWANRLDRDGFFANGKEYRLNPALSNYRYDGNKKPIHGLVVYASEWKVIDVKAGDDAASVTSRLEFWRYPDWMAQFPFAHTIDMVYRLRDGVLEVETILENHSTETMPVSVGYHPYFKIHDAPRERWKVRVPAREQMVLSDVLVPTGETRRATHSDPQPLAGVKLDDVFTSLVAGADGRTEFWVQGDKQKISVIYGPKYPVAVVYSPMDRDFICFEPMTGPTNAFNLHHTGKYKDLQAIAPGGKWRESFWIKPSGF